MEDRTTMVIDCDAGIDDAVAIMMALAEPRVNLIGITCVNGNTPVEKVTINVLRVLQKCGRLDIPVYSGTTKDFLGTAPVTSAHGQDGLGDFPNPETPPSGDLVQSEHAVEALIFMANEHQGEITLVAIGPLTNVALAMKLDLQFTSKLKELVIMGGNILATGTRFPASEFNFTVDPTAAHIVVTGTQCPTTLVPLETCISCSISTSWFESLHHSKKAKFVAAMYTDRLKKAKTDKKSVCMVADGCAMVVAVSKASIKKATHTPCQIELHEGMTKGQMVTSKIYRPWAKSFPGPEINVVIELDMGTYHTMLDEAVR
eukprot:XP_011661066.1 PREDICTED: probable uridine nucleosidase 2 isoform X2 [Strongylocentrotus purpuratus]